MSKLKIKVCGMTDAQNMCEIGALKPNFFGLIFYPKSPRFVSAETIKGLPQFEEIKRVGVFVNESLENIITIAEQTNLSFIQLHGQETPEFCKNLKVSGLQVIKAFAVDNNFKGANLGQYESVCDYFLFDTKTMNHGGSGESFDWQILHKLLINKPFFLSGGVGAENAAEAIAACAGLPLYALDINSRAETAPGIKSPKIAAEIIKSL
ncbi:MAG: phosphoribosylanthranilate isomerase [Pyrinomonadaceae bacterium]